MLKYVKCIRNEIIRWTKLSRIPPERGSVRLFLGPDAGIEVKVPDNTGQ